MTVTTLRHRVIAVSFGGALLATASPALAQEPVEAAIRGWVAAIDASPNWVAGFDQFAYDDATRTATLRNLSIRSETLSTKVEVTFGSLSVAGYGQTADGGFTATDLTATDSRIVIGTVADMKLASIGANGITVPSFTSYAFDPARMFSSVVKAYGIGAQTAIATLKIDGIAIASTFEGQTSQTSYGGFELTGMAGGKIDRMTFGPFKQEAPSPDGLVTMRADSFEVQQVDLNAMIDVFDQDRYPGGIGDRTWRTAVALERYTNIVTEVPGGQFRVGSGELHDLRVRQPRKSFAPFFDQVLANPKMTEEELARLSVEHVPNLIYAFGIGSIRVSDIDMTAPDVERFHLGDIYLNDFSSDGLGEFGLGDLDVAADGSSIGAERLALGGLVFPDIDTVAAAIRANEAGLPSSPAPLIPTLGFAEAANVSVVHNGKMLAALDRGRLDLRDYIGPVATSVTLDIKGVDIDLAELQKAGGGDAGSAALRTAMSGLGYERLQADAGATIRWNQADQSLNISDLRFAAKDAGSVTANVVFTGLTRPMIEQPNAESLISNLVFSRADLMVKDASLMGRIVGMMAKRWNVTPEKARADIAGALPLAMMLQLRNPEFQKKLQPALISFINQPGTLMLTAAPVSPVPLVAILGAIEDDPRKLPTLLSVDVRTGE